MTDYEKEELKNLPSKYQPIGAWGYFGYSILFAIPIVGFIALIVCALSSSNINRRSFARSYFCVLIIIGVIVGVAVALGVGETLLEFFKSQQ